MKKISLSISLLLFSITYSLAQTPGIQWQQTLGTKDNDFIGRIIKTSDGGMLVFGEKGTNDGYGDLWIIKKNAEGITEWEKVYGGSGDEYAYSAVETSDHSFALAGISTSIELPGHHGVDSANSQYDEERRDAWVIKLSDKGDLLWQKFIGGTLAEEANGIAIDDQNNLLISGWVHSKDGDFSNIRKDTSSYGGYDGFVAKINGLGQLMMLKCFGGNDFDYLHDIIKDGNEFMIVGSVSSNDGDVSGHKIDTAGNYFSAYRSDIWVAKIDSNLNLMKQKCFGGSLFEDGIRVKKISQNKYAIAGSTSSTDGDVIGHSPVVNPYFNTDGWFFEIDSSFSLIGQKCMGESQYDEFYDFDILPGGGYIIGGQISDTVFGNSSAWAIKLDSNKNIIWDKKVGGSKYDEFYGVAYIAPGYYYFGGDVEMADGDVATSFGENDGWLIRLGDVNTITGKTFVDVNNNNQYDAGDKLYKGLKIQSEKGSFINGSVTNETGEYKVSIDTGTYTTKAILTNPYYTIIPDTKNTSFSTYFNTDTVDFALKPIAGKKDLVVSLLPLSVARPGFDLQYRLLYFNRGTDIIPNGKVKFLKDAKLNFVSASPANASVSGDTLIWDFTNFKPFDTAFIDINFKVAVSPTANIGDSLVSKAFIEPSTNDETPSDNVSISSQVVRGSYDPNDKTEIHSGKLTPQQLSGNEYLTYLIRFQNTGTDTAYNVFVRDTLDSNLDWNSLEMISSSHKYALTVKDGNQLEWFFTNVKLPDSNINEKASHGYIAYRIKPKGTLAEGDSVTNKASIYFDFNLAVNTNNDKTFIRSNIVTAVIDLNNKESQLYLYPNPTNGQVVVSKSDRLKGNAVLQVRDINGKLLRQLNYGLIYTESFRKSVDLHNLSRGYYLINLRVGKSVYQGKLIIQ